MRKQIEGFAYRLDALASGLHAFRAPDEAVAVVPPAFKAGVNTGNVGYRVTFGSSSLSAMAGDCQRRAHPATAVSVLGADAF